MARYSYKAQDDKGTIIKGVMIAASEEQLHFQLKETGLMLISAKSLTNRSSSKQLKNKQLSSFCLELGNLLGAGVTLVRAIKILADDEAIDIRERSIYNELLRQIRTGILLSDAMESQEGVFPILLISMMRSAETTGNLDKTLVRMADYFTKQFRLESKIKSSMTYPKILAVLIVVVVAVIMGYVMPQFSDLFAQMEELPATTKVLMAISDFVANYWYVLIIGAIAAYAVITLVTRVPRIKLQIDKWFIHMPVFGKLQKIICTARFARTLSSLYSSGVSIINSLQISRRTIGNAYIESQFDEMITFIRGGGNLSDGLDTIDGFSKKLASSIRVGEQTGSLDSMLDSLADQYDYESEMAINRMVSYIEPAMIIVMAVIVGFIMISVIQPIYGSYAAIGASAK